ncbi:MAG: NAD+ synthase [Candidatus Omnitrophota bacterium]|jgi:NAD+ synthase|nr:MAG: NAD+ synthase [Candidatus Omnitrophota bacterium]
MKSKIIRWLAKEVKSSGAKGIVLGLSGGIDSCVVSALAKAAVGKNNVLGLMMPCHSHPSDLKDAKISAKKLNIQTKIIDLTSTYDGLRRVLPPSKGLAAVNLRPRLRMLVLYYFANKLDYLVCGTGNKSELMVGYFTKYGDGGVDLLPIGDLTKTQVRSLARELEIPGHIITKPPSAGLWVGQTDEGEMGITYAELDDILSRLERGLKQVAAKDKVKKVKDMINRSQHKREKAKICKVS